MKSARAKSWNVPDPIKIEDPVVEPAKKESPEEIIAGVYKIPVEELQIKTQAILRTETNGIEDPNNPMQVQKSTAEESIKIFGVEKFNEITAKITPEQKNIFVGQITFARYRQNAQIAFEKFPSKLILSTTNCKKTWNSDCCTRK